MKGINLLKSKESNVVASVDRFGRLRFFSIIFIFIVSVFSVVLFVLVAFSPLPQLKRQEQNAKFVLSEFYKDMAKISFLDQRTDLIRDILSEQSTNSKTIEALQAKVPNGVSIIEFKINKDTTSVSFSSKSLRSFNMLLDNIVQSVEGKKDFSQVVLKNISTESEGGYILTLHLVNL